MQRLRSTRIHGLVAGLIAITAHMTLGTQIALAGSDAPAAPPSASHQRHAADACDPEPCDPLIPAVRRIDRYLQRHEVNGIVLDSRYVINATEAARLSVVPQLLAYAELYRVSPLRRLRRDIVERADFLMSAPRSSVRTRCSTACWRMRFSKRTRRPAIRVTWRRAR